MDTPDLPKAVRDAQVLLEEQHRGVRGMLAFTFFGVLILVTLAGLGLEMLLVPGVLAFLAFAFYGAWRGAQDAPRFERARAMLQEWDRKQLEAEIEPAAAPEDPRWQGALRILDRVRALGGDDHRTTELAADLRGRLRALLDDAAGLRDALEAQRSLADGDARTERLQLVLHEHEALISRLLGGLSDIHVELSVRKAREPEQALTGLSDLLLQLSAEAEVDQVDTTDPRNERRRAAAAAKACRESDRGK